MARTKKKSTPEDKVEAGYIDLTKTGPLSYRELQSLNSGLPKESTVNSMIPDAMDIAVGNAAQRAGRVNWTETPTGLGESMYDPGVATQNQIEHLQDYRANAQPWYAKIGAGLAKGTILAGTTFLDGTIGLLVGGAEALKRGDWSGLWDNDFSRAMQSVNEWSEEALPNYYTQEEQNSPWYENIFTANFLGDKFIKNLGFSVGALYSGGVSAAGLRLTKLPQLIGAITKSSKAPAAVSTLVGATVSAVNEGRIEALNNSKDWQNLKIQELDDNWRNIVNAKYTPDMEALRGEYQAALEEYEATKGKLQKTDAGYVDPANLRYQAKIAALDKRVKAIQDRMNLEWKNRGSDKTYNDIIGKIEEDRLKMGNTDMLLNLPILMASNIVQFTKFYSNGFNTARRVGVRTVEDTASGAARYAGESFSKGRAALRITKGALSEGTEEISQKAASLISGNYYSTDVDNFYKSQIDHDAEQETLDWMKSFASGINETVNDASSWEEFFIGSLTGLLGIPSFRSVRNSDGSLRLPIELQGGAINEMRDYRQEITRSQEVANYLNSRVQSPEFLNYYRGLIRHNKYQNDMDRAVEEDDEFNFKNAEHAQFVSDIIMFDNAGKLEDLRTYIDTAFDLSDENLQSIVENTTTTDENGNKVGPFVDSNGNPMYATEEGKQQMINKLTQSRNTMIEVLDNYRNTKNDIDVRTGGNLSDDQLTELTWIKTQVDDWAKRTNEMTPLIKRTLTDLSNNLENTLIRSFGDASMEESVTAEESIEGISKLANQLGIGTNRIKQLNDLVKLDNKKLATILTSPKNSKFVEKLIDDISTFGSDIISTLDKQNVVRLLRDLPKIGKGIEVYSSKLEEYLTNPDKQSAEQTAAAESVRDNIQQRKNQTFKETLSNTTSLSEFREAFAQEDNPETKENVLRELDNEGSQIAKNYTETEQYDRELKKALNELKETDQVSQDALTLWRDQFDKAENLNQIANPNSIYINDEGAFLEDSGGDVDMAENRFQNARYALQRAMSKVNNDMKFRDRFSEEYRKPVDEPVRNKGVDKDTTGDSGTSTVPPVNPNAAPVETPSAPIGNITSDMVAAENRDANRRVETQRNLDQSQQGQRKYYRPAVPELHIEASKEGDFRPFDVVVAERESGVDFSGIYNYLRDNGAFSYVNAAKLKPGDTLGFMIDPEFNDHTIFLVDTRNNQIVGSIDESDASIARYEGLENVINKVRDEFAKRGEEATGKFFATSQVRVSKIMVGRIPFTSEERSLADIPGVLDGDTKPVFGIIKNGVLTTNEKIDDRLIIKPADMAQKEGRLYLLIPNAAGTYSPAAVRVKHFNNQEFNLEDATVSSTPIGRGINEALDRLSDATSQDDVSIAMKELARDLYMQDVMITWFDAKSGSGIVISRKAKKSDGTYDTVIINGQEQIREDKYTIYFQNSKNKIDYGGIEITRDTAEASIKEGTLPADILNLFGQPRDTSEVRKDILNTLLRFNLPLQVSVSRINDSGYNNRIIKSNILTSNLREAKVIGSWFTTDYFNNQGNLQGAISPASVKFAPERRVTTPVGGTEGVIQGTRVFVSGTPYIVDLKNSIATNEKTGEKRAFSEFNSQQLIDLAWAQETFGDSTESSIMTENKIITPKGEVLDRSTGKYIHGAEAQRIKDKIAGITRDTVKTTLDSKSEDYLPIFDSSTESLIAKPEEQNRVLPENAFEEGEEVGYYELGGKVYTGYLKKIGEIEATTGSGQKIMIPIHVTKVRDRGLGRKGELGPTSEYIPVFPNGKAISTKTNAKSDSYAAEVIMKTLSANPEKVLTLSTEKTQIHDPGELERTETELLSNQYSTEPTQTNGAASTIQMEDAINNHDEEFEDDLDLGELRRVDDMSRETWNQEKELAWLKKVLPQLSDQARLRIVKGLIQIANKGTEAWGAYQNGIITLSDVAAEGTVYHEAFHAVFDLLLNEEEKKLLLDEAREKWGNLSDYDLKEELAEAFREYMAAREDRGLGRRILDFFKELFDKVTNFKFMKPSMTAYFQMVNQGRYIKETLGESTQEEPEFRHWKDVYKKGIIIADYPMNSDINQYHKQNFMDKKGDSRMTKNGEGYHMFKEEVVRFHYMSDGELVIDKVVSRDSKEAAKIREEIEFLKNLEDNPEERSKFNKAFPNWNERSQEERDNAIECRGLNS